MADVLTIEELRDRFKRHGLRFTHQRYTVYQALAASRAHPSAEELYARVRRNHPTLARNTVYTTLEALQAIGIASEISLWHDRARFDANARAHHHLVCIDCKKIEDVYDDSLDRLALPARLRSRYRVTAHRVEFHGFCSDCQTRNPPRADSASSPRTASTSKRRTSWPKSR